MHSAMIKRPSRGRGSRPSSLHASRERRTLDELTGLRSRRCASIASAGQIVTPGTATPEAGPLKPSSARTGSTCAPVAMLDGTPVAATPVLGALPVSALQPLRQGTCHIRCALRAP